MVFNYPTTPHVRRHGPQGYTNYQEYKPWLRDEFCFRCIFCLQREHWAADPEMAFSIDHFVPRDQAPERINDYDNLLYVCMGCNASKREQTGILDPSLNALADHLCVREDGIVEGLTIDGTRLIRKLRLNRPRQVEFRARMLQVISLLASSQDPEVSVVLQGYLGYPENLPDLRRLRPPGKNSRPEGVNDCCFARRERGELPSTY